MTENSQEDVKEMKAGVERRRFPRLDLRIPVRYRKLETGSTEFRGSLIKDISEGGTKMTIYEFLPLNLKLTMEIPLVSAVKPVEGTGRVAWIAKAPFSEMYDVGVEFVSLNQGDRSQIADFVFNNNLEL